MPGSDVLASGLVVVLVTLGMSAAMAGAWLIRRWTGNAGWVDAIWTLATGAACVVYALTAGEPRGWLVAGLAAVWALRLGGHIVARASRGGDDPRYARLKADWGAAFELRLFRFLQLQALAGALLAMAAWLAARNPAMFPGAFDVAGAAVVIGAIGGEAVADAQLAAFRRSGEKGVYDRGLWAWSRHPNYFFEWLVWVGIALIALDPTAGWPWGVMALLAPLYMWWLLTRVSGIPPLEAHMARTRGQAWCDYVARTSAFFPWPPQRTV